jgi:hypothetical protein
LRNIADRILGRGDADEIEERPPVPIEVDVRARSEERIERADERPRERSAVRSRERSRGNEPEIQLDELSIDDDDDDTAEMTERYMNFTRNDPIGATLLMLAADNSNLCAKVGLKKSHTSIRTLAKSFYLHTTAQRQMQASSFERSVELVEQHLLEKELNNYMMSIGYPPPTKFHPEAKLTTASAKAEAMKIFPTRNKFSGNGQPGDLGVIEWLHLLGHSQAACELSRAEFKDMLLICSTGKAHMLILEWSTNGESIETIYHNVLTHYDNRLTPGEAKALLFQYKIPKSSSLSEAVSYIMDLAGRASSSLPPGEARTALYNLEATECLIRSLPPSAKITATNIQSQLSSKLGRAATITELNRGLNVYRTTIDSEIKSRGHVPDKEKAEKKPYKGKWQKKSAAGPSTMSLQTNPPP